MTIGKKPINRLSIEEHEILTQILINCAVKISKILSEHQDPKAYAKFLGNLSEKKSNLVGMKLFTELPNINFEKLYRQIDLKELI